MTNEQNKVIVRRFIDASGACNEAALKELLAADFVAHQPGGPQNREAFVQHLNYFCMAFSDSHFTVQEQVAEGDTVVTETTLHAVHSGDFQGVPPTGKQIAISAILIVRVEEGKIVEHRGLFDQLSMMQQLGLVPPPQPAS
jgi:steroid delta-isomerase-like uncharacterized protein